MAVLPYMDLWFELLNAQLHAGRRSAIDAHLQAVLGESRRPLSEDFFLAHAGMLQSLRDAWREAGRQPTVLLLQPVVDQCARGMAPGVLDALLAPGLVRSPANNKERQSMMLRACLLGVCAHLQCADAAGSLRRCEGLGRRVFVDKGWEQVRGFEQLAPQELKVRIMGADSNTSMQRCPVIFRPRGRGAYCSRSCRDRNVALRRGLQDPRYVARRQARYRQRKKGPS